MASTTDRVAIITGGSGGIGLAVAQALAVQKEEDGARWQIHLLDTKADEGAQAASALPNTTFHHVDVRHYDALAAAFQAAFVAGGQRLDFVFANAGLFEKTSTVLRDPTTTALAPPPDPEPSGSASSDHPPPPPPRQPDYAAVAVNLQGAVDTVHLARHFMRRSAGPAREGKGPAIVVTASCSSVWPTYWAPIYTASKFGILGFTRAVAGHYKVMDGIRMNALLPGAVKTPIIEWGNFPEDTFTPMELVVEVVLNLVAGGEIVDSKGTTVPPEKAYGQAVLVTGKNFYVHPETEYPDEVMAHTIESTRVDSRFKDRV